MFRVLRRLAAALFALTALHAAAEEAMVFVMDPFPPFTYEADGKPAGPLSDTIRAVCAEIHVECRLETYPWRRALKLAENGEVDGLYAVVPIAEREQFFYLTPPIVQSAYGVFVPARSTLRYSRPHDLDGYTVGAYGPSAASRVLEDVATQASGLKMEIELDNLRLLKMLSSGRYGERAAAIANVDVGMQLVREHHLEGLRVAGLIGHTEYAIGLSRRKVSAERAQAFNAALLRLMRSGEIRRIVERHGLRPAP